MELLFQGLFYPKIQTRVNLLVFTTFISTVFAMLNCDIHVDGISFNLLPLNGTHQISNSLSTPPSVTNFTWLFDPCEAIIRENNKINDSEACPEGSQSK